MELTGTVSILQVNAVITNVTAPSGGAVNWGAIGGTLSSQSDLQDALDLKADTSQLHSAVTVTDSSEIDFTLTGQDITASLKAGSVDVLKLDSGVQGSLGLADSSLQSVNWGGIGGTLSSQTDLQAELDLKLNREPIADSAHYTGFPNRTDTSLSWDDGTYTLTLTASGAEIWIEGVKYTINTLTQQITQATAGVYWFWITAPGGTPQLNTSTTAPGFDKCLVATAYWNTTAGIIVDERHWFGRDQKYHEYLHETFGARYAIGLAGTFDNTTFTIDAGEFYDEDIEHISTQQTTAKVLYKDGSANWTWDAGATTPYKAVTGALQYNNGTALASVGNSKFTTSWVYITGDETHPVHIYIDDAEYNTVALAREAGQPSRGVLTSPEDKLIYKVIFQNSGGTPTYIEAEDFRASAEAPSGITTDHGSLAGLGDDDHMQYIKDSEFTQDSGILVGTGAGTFAEETGATLRTSIGISATNTPTDTTNFDNNLSSADDTVQKALETLDELTAGGGGAFRYQLVTDYEYTAGDTLDRYSIRSGSASPTINYSGNRFQISCNASGEYGEAHHYNQYKTNDSFFDSNPRCYGSAAFYQPGLGISGLLWNGSSFAYFNGAENFNNVHFGIYNQNGTVYASNANGTAQTTTNITTAWGGGALGTPTFFEIIMTSGTDIKFYISGTLAATHTTNLPSGDFQDGYPITGFCESGDTNSSFFIAGSQITSTWESAI